MPKEREDFYRRLEEAQQKLIIAQNNLEKVLQKHQQEKKVTFKENSPAKVSSGDVDWLSNLLNILHILHSLLKLILWYFKGRPTDVKAIAQKSKNVQKALEEMQKREEQLKNLHEKEQQSKEQVVHKRKEEMEQKIRDKILSANRF